MHKVKIVLNGILKRFVLCEHVSETINYMMRVKKTKKQEGSCAFCSFPYWNLLCSQTCSLWVTESKTLESEMKNKVCSSGFCSNVYSRHQI